LFYFLKKKINISVSLDLSLGVSLKTTNFCFSLSTKVKPPKRGHFWNESFIEIDIHSCWYV